MEWTQVVMAIRARCRGAMPGLTNVLRALLGSMSTDQGLGPHCQSTQLHKSMYQGSDLTTYHEPHTSRKLQPATHIKKAPTRSIHGGREHAASRSSTAFGGLDENPTAGDHYAYLSCPSSRWMLSLAGSRTTSVPERRSSFGASSGRQWGPAGPCRPSWSRLVNVGHAGSKKC